MRILKKFTSFHAARQFADHRCAEDADCTENFKAAERFVQDEGREQDGGDGVKIAQDRERLRREIGHRAKIEAVGEAGVDDAEDQQRASWPPVIWRPTKSPCRMQ